MRAANTKECESELGCFIKDLDNILIFLYQLFSYKRFEIDLDLSFPNLVKRDSKYLGMQ